MNGPAFPTLGNVAHNSDWTSDDGMSLRDWFATQALVSVGTWMPEHGGGNLATSRAMRARAVWAYEQADALLAARSQEQDRG